MGGQINHFLNSKTSYWLTLTGLLFITTVSIILSLIHFLPFSPFWMIVNLLILAITCQTVNQLVGKLLKTVPNKESSYITAFILFLILTPTSTLNQLWLPVLAATFATFSKYLIAYNGKHLFNPAAAALLLLTISGRSEVSWWVANPHLLPFVLLSGSLVAYKIRRFPMVIIFSITSLLTISLNSFTSDFPIIPTIIQAITSWPLIFFATIMLTEPSTTPPTQKLQFIYAATVGVLFGSQFHLGPIFTTPELALILGNLVSYLFSYKTKIILRLKQTDQIGSDIFQFTFSPHTPVSFQPGQYFELTAPDNHSDDRGNRRYLTIASSPTEKDLRFAIRINRDQSSTFKRQLLSLKSSDKITASQLAGDFVLPQNSQQKLVFIAGGIGITPFASMIKYLLDTNQKRDITLLYFNKKISDIIYQNLFSAGSKIGLKNIYILTDDTIKPTKQYPFTGHLNEQLISQTVPDFQHRLFYLSGPNAMVSSYKQLLTTLGISKSQIRTDYFPGY